jgi:hypothetical protein
MIATGMANVDVENSPAGQGSVIASIFGQMALKTSCRATRSMPAGALSGCSSFITSARSWVSVAPMPRCFSGPGCDVHRAMSVEMDHMFSGAMASDLGGGRLGVDTALHGAARV